MKVRVIFFMKGEYRYGEFATLPDLPGVKVSSFGLRKLMKPGGPSPEEIEQGRLALEAARESVNGGKYDLVILDEINVAAAWEIIKTEDVIKLIKEKTPCVELILTGRYADPGVIELADLVTEMKKIKHPYDKGVKARKGFDF